MSNENLKAPEIKVIKDYVVSGYAHAGVTIKPWVVFIDRRPLLDTRRRPRRFATERAARTAALKAGR